MKKQNRIIMKCTLSALAALLTMLDTSRAASGTWTGLGGDSNWTTPGNWTPGIPGSTSVTNNADTATFNGNTGLTVTPDLNRNLKTFTFDTASVGSFTIGTTGGNALILSSGAVLQITAAAASNVTETINAPLLLMGGMSLTNSQASGTSALKLGGSITSGAASGTQTITVSTPSGTTATGNNEISGNIGNGSSGGTIAMAVTTSSTGVFTLSGNNTFSGGVNWTQAGVLNLNSSTALGTGTFTLGSGGRLDNTSGSAVTLTPNNAITINNNFTYGGSNDLDLGMGAVYLGTAGTSTFRRITINGSNLTIGGVISNGSNATTVTVTGNSTGALTLSGANLHTGGVNIGLATLNINNASALGSGTLTIAAGANLDNTSGSAITLSTNNAQTWQTDFTFHGSNDLNLGTGAVTTAASRTVTVAAKNLTLGGTLGFGTTTVLTKNGAGSLTLTAANTYLGKTQINAGTLLINGSHVDSASTNVNGYGSAATGHFQVAASGTLGGSGRIAGNTAAANSNMVLVESGGTLAPGASIGTLVLDGGSIGGAGSKVLNMASGALFSFELAGNGTSSDQVNFWNFAANDFLLNSNAVNLTLSGTNSAGTYTVSLFKFYSNSGTTLTSSGITSGLTLGTIGTGISGTPTFNYNAGGNTIDLTYTVVPEPKASSSQAFGLTTALIFRRRTVR